MLPWTIWTNHLFTRRKTFFYVVSPDDEIVFRDRWFWPCIEFLDTMEVKEYVISPANQQGRSVHCIAATKVDPPIWPN